MRKGAEEERIHPRRSICAQCGGGRGKTHVLLPDSSLIRRRDHVEVIVSAIEARAAGESRASIAERLGRHEDTVRGWLRAFARNAEAIGVAVRAMVLRLLGVIGRSQCPAPSPTADNGTLASSAMETKP